MEEAKFRHYEYNPIKVRARQFFDKDYFKKWSGHKCGIRKIAPGKFYLQKKDGGEFVEDGDWIILEFGKYRVIEKNRFKRLLRRQKSFDNFDE